MSDNNSLNRIRRGSYLRGDHWPLAPILAAILAIATCYLVYAQIRDRAIEKIEIERMYALSSLDVELRVLATGELLVTENYSIDVPQRTSVMGFSSRSPRNFNDVEGKGHNFKFHHLKGWVDGKDVEVTGREAPMSYFIAPGIAKDFFSEGQHKVTLQYQIGGILDFAKSREELVAFPIAPRRGLIKKASVELKLPPHLPISDARWKIVIISLDPNNGGTKAQKLGEKELETQKISHLATDPDEVDTLRFTLKAPLPPENWLAIRAAWPLGYIKKGEAIP